MAQTDQNYLHVSKSLVPPSPAYGVPDAPQAAMENLQGRALRLVTMAVDLHVTLDHLDPDGMPPSQPSADKPGPLPGLAELLDTAARLLDAACGRASQIQNRVGRL